MGIFLEVFSKYEYGSIVLIDNGSFSFRSSTAETGGNLRDVLESLVRCHLALNDFDKADAVCKKLVKVGHVQNVLLLRLIVFFSYFENICEAGS